MAVVPALSLVTVRVVERILPSVARGSGLSTRVQPLKSLYGAVGAIEKDGFIDDVLMVMEIEIDILTKISMHVSLPTRYGQIALS